MTQLQTLVPHPKDLGGGFLVRRLLPSADRRAIGPFVFFDHFGPIDVPAGAHHDVRPHPHIGLATLTYLFEGAIVHRDSTGVVQRIEPGAVNWMSAGRGIVHSERTPRDLIGREHRSHGLQFWVALPEALESSAPSFQHVAAERIPRLKIDGAAIDVIVGSAFGATSPVETSSPTLAAVIDLGAFGASGLVAARRRRDRACALSARPPHRARRREVRRVQDDRPGAGDDADARRAARRPGRPRRRRAARPPLPFVELRLRRRASGSEPLRTTGGRSASRRFPARPNSSRFRSGRRRSRPTIGASRA